MTNVEVKKINPIEAASRLRVMTYFTWAGLAWAVASIIITVLSASSLLWTLGLWALCMFDFLAMTKALASVLNLMSTQETTNKPAEFIQILFWGTIKLACLALFGVILWQNRTIPNASLILGLSTLVFVPLVGGYFWSRKELKYA